jgi:hypothetical protein
MSETDDIVRGVLELLDLARCQGAEMVLASMKEVPDGPLGRGYMDCYQDRCENVPFASIGGLDARSAPKAPDYVVTSDVPAYLTGYMVCARKLFGEDWRTCTFGWQHALTIGDESTKEPTP